MSLLRLDKIISDSGNATRSEARRLIASGRVWVDGSVVKSFDCKIDTENAEIRLDGKVIGGGSLRYFMLNKPEGVVTATEDKTQRTVLDLLSEEHKRLKLFPVGRLDKDTTGLLILTNDGDFCHAVTSPKRHIKKMYEFTTGEILEPEDVDAFKTGLVLKDGTECLPAFLEIDENDNRHGFVTIFEGKYHQVKRMLASRGKHVKLLKRISIGELSLNTSLQPGELMELTESDVNLIVNKNVTI
ncbi:MAG: rRNA pseudouridine synthase [Oscillospiraceae bacterium]|nr:rRNA pseudouridine synthase [Oscillospiraceae bacterium]